MEGCITISVVIPIYNTEAYLPKCIDSVMEQTYQKMEVILVDDGSTDRCGIICDNYAAKDARIRVVHKRNGGPSDARNVGTQMASGEYICYLDSDDYWELPTALQDMAKIIVNEHPDMILFGYRRQNLNTHNSVVTQLDSVTDGFGKPEDKLRLVRRRQYSNSAWSKLIRRSVLFESKLQFPLGRLCEDLAWSRRLLTCVERISVYPSVVLVYQTGRAGSITASFTEKKYRDILYQLKTDVALIDQLADPIERKAGYAYWAGELCWILAFPPMLREHPLTDCVKELRPYLYLLRFHTHKRALLVRFFCKLIGLKNTMRLLNWFLRNKEVFGLA